MEQEKDHFWYYIAGVIVLAIVVVIGMRGTRDSLEAGVKNEQAQAEAAAETARTIERLHSK